MQLGEVVGAEAKEAGTGVPMIWRVSAGTAIVWRMLLGAVSEAKVMDLRLFSAQCEGSWLLDSCDAKCTASDIGANDWFCMRGDQCGTGTAPLSFSLVWQGIMQMNRHGLISCEAVQSDPGNI